jgi:segregation and condensation protein B
MTEDLLNKIEALLFASGKFMTDENLSLIIGADIKEVKKSLKLLKETYDNSQNSLRLDQENNSWKINVKEKYLDLVRKIVADTELPKGVLETLAVIAYKSPALQSDIVKIRSNKAYEHIAQLEEMGFVIKDKSGRSFKLKVTEKFYEYFDVDNAKSLKEMFKDIKQPKKEAQATLNEEKHEETAETTEEFQEETTEKKTEEKEEMETIEAPVAIPDQPIEAIKDAIEKDQKELKVLEKGIEEKPIKTEKEEVKKENFEIAKKQIQKEEKKQPKEKIVKKKEERKIIKPVKKQEILKNKQLPRKIANIKNTKKELIKPVKLKSEKILKKNSKKSVKKKK